VERLARRVDARRLAPREAHVTARAGVIVHGGAGAAKMEPARLARYRAGLAAAVEAGHATLARGGSPLDAVEAAIRCMEASGAFNAGIGACLNLEK
jgi:beta-aspartyl-peptidase (threonine type)